MDLEVAVPDSGQKDRGCRADCRQRSSGSSRYIEGVTRLRPAVNQKPV